MTDDPLYVERHRINRAVANNLDELFKRVNRFSHCIPPVLKIAAETIHEILQSDASVVGEAFQQREIEGVLHIMQQCMC